MTQQMKVRFNLPLVRDWTPRKENVNSMTLGECMGAEDLTTFVELDRLEEFKAALTTLGSEVLSEELVEVSD